MMAAVRQVALVTGASSGIGKETAFALLEAGYEVVGTSRDVSKVGSLGGVRLIDLDVVDERSVAAAVGGVIDRFGRIDLLVNNAGIGSLGAAEETSVEEARTVFATNVFGVMRMVRAVLPHMRAQRSGRIVNVSSVVGFLPTPYMAVYSASKHAIEGYSQSLDHEVREFGVRSVLVEPAYTSTGFEANTTMPEEPLSAYDVRRRDFGRLLAAAVRDGDDPADVAKVILAAATDARPKLRYTAGPLAGRAGLLRRLAPDRIFDQQIRKLNKLPA
ncbi:oxidoreductase [Nocardioides sp. NPDC051685]|uniref:oxidoreductase n=1 Tax=Nocardioides sp. NPDC051685 TaxID=3364334 RepID=UPI00378D31AB